MKRSRTEFDLVATIPLWSGVSRCRVIFSFCERAKMWPWATAKGTYSVLKMKLRPCDPYVARGHRAAVQCFFECVFEGGVLLQIASGPGLVR